MDNKSIYSKVKIKILILLLFGFAYSIQAQKHFDYNWLFGYGTGVPDSTSPFGGIIMSFNNGQISFIPQQREFEFNCQFNSFSTELGELILMSNGCSIANADANIILNGDSISYGKIWGVNCPKYQPLFQAGIFINDVNNTDTLAYLSTILDTIGNGMKAFQKCIYETKINLSPLKVISKNKIILYDTLFGGLTAVPQIDNSKWWVNMPRNRTNEIYTISYSLSGVEKIIKQNIGKEHSDYVAGVSQSVVSPNGKLYALYSSLDGLQVFDFDRLTGLMSNYRYFNVYFKGPGTVVGCAFSPNSRFVYISNPTEVLQIDLLEQDSTKAIDTVGVFDNFFDPYPATFFEMALGPDCRIYISSGGGNRYLHVITFPNKKGKECQLINRGLKLPTRNSHASANFPIYRLDDPYPCDSTISIPLNTDVENEYKFKEGDLMIYPNPASSVLFLHDIKSMITTKIMLRLINLNGEVKYEQEYKNLQEEIKIPVQNFSPGMYFIHITNYKGNIWTEKFIKI